MSQNRSSAVMQQRSEPHDSLDFFPTPPWATRALCEHLAGLEAVEAMTAWDPACGQGDMVRPLREYFARVYATDVHNYGGEQQSVKDYLVRWDRLPVIEAQGVDWIITNPPFRLAEEFALTAITEARVGVAFFVRSAFLEGRGRLERLFSKHPPAQILQFAERVPLVKGRVDKDAASATAYCWIVWLRAHSAGNPTFAWIAPCRSRLERAGDYQQEAA